MPNFFLYYLEQKPVQRVVTYSDLRDVLMRRIVLSALQFRINNRYKVGLIDPMFLFIILNVISNFHWVSFHDYPVLILCGYLHLLLFAFPPDGPILRHCISRLSFFNWFSQFAYTFFFSFFFHRIFYSFWTECLDKIGWRHFLVWITPQQLVLCLLRN